MGYFRNDAQSVQIGNRVAGSITGRAVPPRSENGDEIKNASKLIVGPGQGCIFVYEGKVEDVYLDEGVHELDTDNVPFWTTITKFMQAFESEHKVGIYYFKRGLVVDQKWGTPSIIKYQDPVYNFPVGLRAFGNYSFRIHKPENFFVQVSGAVPNYTLGEFRKTMGARIIEPLTDYFAEAGFSYADIDRQRDEISDGIEAKIKADFDTLGFTLEDFRIEGTSFDEDTMRRINRIADMSAEAQAAAAAGINYAQMQQLDAMKAAASNEGGGAGMGMGMGAGMAFGNMMAGGMGQQPQQQAAPAEDPVEKLAKLKKMLDADLITQEEYDAKKQDILAQM
jgi:membrane protease subunit (stomatin/prohibitin family)